NAVVFEKGRYFTKGQLGLGKEAFFMLNFGRLLGALGAPTMEIGGQTMVGTHGGFSMHGPMLMAGNVDPNTNFSYATNRQLIAPTEPGGAHGQVERLPGLPYAFASTLSGLVRAADPEAPNLPGSNRLDRLRYGMAANVRWKQLDVYGAVIWDRLYGLAGELRGSFGRSATGLTIQVDYLVHEKVMLSSRF